MTTQQKLIKSKLNLLELGSYLGNVSEACRTLGYSRDTFYRLKKRYEEDGLEGLKEISRRKPNLRNRVPEEVEKAVVDLALDYPAFGQVQEPGNNGDFVKNLHSVFPSSCHYPPRKFSKPKPFLCVIS